MALSSSSRRRGLRACAARRWFNGPPFLNWSAVSYPLVVGEGGHIELPSRQRTEELHAAIAEAFKDLEADERRVMALRFGLEDGVPFSPAKVAEHCGETKDWVRRCETRALRKLRKPHHLLALQNFNLQRQSLTSAS